MLNEDLKKCPYCAEMIKKEAIICRYCGKEQPVLPKPIDIDKLVIKRDKSSEIKDTYNETKTILCIATLILIILFSCNVWFIYCNTEKAYNIVSNNEATLINKKNILEKDLKEYSKEFAELDRQYRAVTGRNIIY